MYCLSNIKLIRICCAPRSQVLCFNTNQTQVYSAVSPPGGFERKSSLCMILGSDHGSVDFHTHGHAGPDTTVRWSLCVCWLSLGHTDTPPFQTDSPSPKKAPDSSAARISRPQGSCHSPAERLAFDHDLFVGSGHDSAGRVVAAEGRPSSRTHEQPQSFLFRTGVQAEVLAL